MMGNAPLVVALAAALHAWVVPPFGMPRPASIFAPDSALDPTQVQTSGVQGSLDKEIIRRVIRGHIDEVKSCYEQELGTRPDLFGRIMVQFTIAASGHVIASVLQNSTMDDVRVESCTVQAVRRWEFPKPLGGGIVIVSYPFMLTAAPFFIAPRSKSGEAVEIAPLNDRILVHRSIDVRGISSNGLVAITERGLLLVDTAWTETQTETILKWGDARLKRPWIGAVITHDHADRDGGLGVLERRHIPVAALDLTIARLARRGVRNVAVLFTARDGALKDDRGFEAFYPGPGHAFDNIVVRFPSVLFGGCLIKSMEAKDLGFTGDADLGAWPAAIRKVRDRFGDKTIVPGHGPVDLNGDAYQHTLDLLSAVNPSGGP